MYWFLISISWVSANAYFKWNSHTTAKVFQNRFNKATASANIHEAVLYAENSTDTFSESFGYGGRDIDSPMIIASVTKLFATSCILKLYEEKQLSLDDPIALYIDDEILQELHIYKGVEYSFDITISDLFFKTSGLPDYFNHSELVQNVISNGGDVC